MVNGLIDNWVLALCLVPLVYFVWCVLHEFAHLLIVWRLGGTVYGFLPYPHRFNGKWYFARLPYSMPSSVYFSSPLLHTAPLVFDFLAVAVLLAAWDVHFVVAVFLLGGLVDMITWSIGYSDTSDLASAAAVWKVSRWGVRIAVWLFIALCILVAVLKATR